jgi:hypothetical protein
MKVLLVTLLGFAGLGTSFALADGGHHVGRDATTSTTTTQCQRAVVFGTAAPQSFVVTVQKSNHNSPFAPGQVITVSVGKTGDTVRVFAGGCASGSTLNSRSAMVSGPWNHKGHDGDHHGTTTGSTTTNLATTTSK